VLALAAVLVGGLLVRLYGLRHGLPFSYHPDEALHFTSRAVPMFTDGLNPGYFQNPSAFTYLVHLALRFQWGGGWPFGDFSDLLAEWDEDPTEIYMTARQVAVALALAGVAGTYFAARRLWGELEGVAAAAILSFAFLPVAYSRYAVTDVGAFLPVALAVYGAIRVHEDGGRRWFVLAGAATGFAIGFKYTAGLLLVPLLLAAALRLRSDGRRAVLNAALAVGAMVVAFLVTTPYFLLDLRDAIDQLRAQSYAADEPKVGQDEGSPFAFYPVSLTWGLGWGAALAAAAGFVWQFRRDRARAVLLAVFPLLLYLYLCGAERHFARWLMPTYPILAMLAGFALARTARSLSLRPRVQAAALAALLGAVLAQPVLADLRTGKLMGREDTRTQARDFLLDRFERRARVVLEPSFPPAWFRGMYVGFGPPPRYRKDYPPLPARPTRFIYASGPERIDRFRRAGFCTVVVTSFVRERAEKVRAPRALAYYRRLERESRVIFRTDPYDPGATPIPFDVDRSTHLYELRAFERPGPEIAIHRLKRCRQGYGRPVSGDPAVRWN
jgi:hypothetical protein